MVNDGRTQAERDDAEWNNPANWHGGVLGLYCSRADRRTFVPKRNPAMGVTINLARPAGVAALIGLLLYAALIVVLARRASR